jgi:DNA-binding CsgD family transcriptional regulator
MPGGDPDSGLRGRRSECDALDRLVEGVRAAASQVLVLRGEAGVGKTVLLEYLTDRAMGCRLARAAGVESEMELAFAGVHQLCAPMLDGMAGLPDPQREALGTAFGLSAGEAPDRFLVGLAVLTLLSEMAESRPLVCIVDDAQWLDRASAEVLAFVARRLLAESIALVFAVREPTDEPQLPGLPELVVTGLGDDDARALLDAAVPQLLDERVRTRIVAETGGNPLALLELTRGLTTAELEFGFGLPDAMPMASRIEQGFLRQLQPLPIATRRLLLTAAVEPVGDVTLLWRAGAQLGIDTGAAAPAEAAGLVRFGARVRFRHPLVRSAVCRDADLHDLQESHRALAQATDPDADPDRRAWHRAHAATGPDEDVAAELERAAHRALSRGGVAAGAAFLARAAELTPDPAVRGARALEAGHQKLYAAEFEAGLELVATADLCPLDALQRAQAVRLRASLLIPLGRGGPALLLEAAEQLESLDPATARGAYLGAVGSSTFTGRLGDPDVRALAAAARAAPPAPEPPRVIDLLLDALTVRFTEGYHASLAPIRRAIRAVVDERDGDEHLQEWLWFAPPLGPEVWDDEGWDGLTSNLVTLDRDAGALYTLPIVFDFRASFELHAGRLDAASALVEEANAVSEATGNVPTMNTALELAGWRGREARAVALFDETVATMNAFGIGRIVGLAEYARAVLGNGLGRYDDALAAAQRACEYEDLAVFGWALAELVEAAVRSGDEAAAASAAGELEARTAAAGTDWALGVGARSRALLEAGDAADACYREAIERLGRTGMAAELARAHLLYGEWLRREHRRVEAREHLREAHEMLERMGAEAFAERARRELAATGETVRKRTPETRDALTAQEAQIARLASQRHTNPEIGAQLFISPRTVEYHLGKVFTKLGISSRRELAGALEGSDGRTPAAAG